MVLGYSQTVGMEVNLRNCEKYGTAIVRRFTGGGTVYHDDGNLNWTVAARREDQIVPKDVFAVFQVFGEVVSDGIKILGLNAQFEFPNVIRVERRKVSGMAMAIRRDAVLCHGTMLVDTNLEILSEVLAVPSPRSRRAETTTLKQQLGRHVSIQEVKKAVEEAFGHLLGPQLEKEPLKEVASARRLYEEKYRRREWNLNRSHPLRVGVSAD